MSIHLIKSNALFLHIPKTGGIWIEEALRSCGIATEYAETLRAASWRHPLRSQFVSKFRLAFSFVRHPLTWYESWWKFQAGDWQSYETGVWHPQRLLDRCAADNFADFIRLCLQYEPAYVSRMYEWYLGPEGAEFVNLVASYENLADDLVQILRFLSYEFDEAALRNHPPANVSHRRLGEPVWDETLKQIVLALETPALRRFYSTAARNRFHLGTARTERTVQQPPRPVAA